MNKLKIIIIFLLLIFFSNSAFAQSQDTLQKFAEVQRALAGDPSEWRFRQTTEETNFFYPVPIGPKNVLDIEDSARLRSSVDTDPVDENDISLIKFAKEYLDEESGKGAFWRALGGGKQFSGNYKLKSDKATELAIIKDIYEQITSRVSRYGVPSDNNPASCLAENTGVCRHMATILQESLEDYGIKSEQIFSPSHTWVRVTLSDPRYAGSLFDTFDLDPTWYAQPIPLPPRNSFYISDAWKKMVLAIAPSGSPTPTPSISVTPTPTMTLTPTPTMTLTPTPTISDTPEPTAQEENSSNPTTPNSSGNSNCEGCGPWTVPR